MDIKNVWITNEVEGIRYANINIFMPSNESDNNSAWIRNSPEIRMRQVVKKDDRKGVIGNVMKLFAGNM